ncbi:MAG: DUF2318 domain-containing protein [Deltaproteobacteria bacterium]
MKIYSFIKSFSVRWLIAVTVILTLAPFASGAVVWNFTVPTVEVRPTNRAFVFPASSFANGRAQYFVYKHSPSQWIRFFILKSRDGVIRAAFDACDVCFRSKKGYIQRGNNMVCANCGLKFKSEKINEIKGGCNPAPLRRTLKGANLIISQRDMMSGLRFFQ